MRKHTANDNNKIIELNTTVNKEWTFSHKAKTEYPFLRTIVRDANEAAEANEASLLSAHLIWAGEKLDGRENCGCSQSDLDGEFCRVVRQMIEAETQRFIRSLFSHKNGKATIEEAVALTYNG